MQQGKFYYLTEQYFIDFPDSFLMTNKETINGQPHGRPCFYAFYEEKTALYWMIPISSQVNKYRKYYDSKIKKYGKCDTIIFGKVLGHEKAFLIQNMCPVIERYIKNEYIDSKNSDCVSIEDNIKKDIENKAKRVLLLQRKGAKLIFPDVLKIEKDLLKIRG